MVITRSDLLAKLQGAYDLLKAGQVTECERELLRLLREAPNCMQAYELLSDVETRLHKFGHAALALQRVTSLDPDNANAWHQLGAIHGLRGDWTESTIAYEFAASLSPNCESHIVALAYAQMADCKLSHALLTRDILLSRFPESPHSHLINAHLLRTFGEFESAESAYVRALQIEPSMCLAIYNLADLRPPTPADPWTQEIIRLSNDGAMTNIERANLDFALGRIYEHGADYRRAFEHYCKANDATRSALLDRGCRYEPVAAAKRTDSIVSRFPAQCFQRSIGSSSIDIRPIFIVGMPRSGTTLIEQILGCDDEITKGGELTGIPTCYNQYCKSRNKLNLTGPVCLSNDKEEHLLREMRQRYIDHLFERDLDARYVTDKLPGNYERLGFIRMMFPDSIIIHCKRNPIATCWSLYSSNFANHDPYYTNLEDLAHYYHLYWRLMSHWYAVLRSPVIDLEYETLVSNPEGTIRSLVASCGLTWDCKFLEFYRNNAPVMTASYKQVRKPIYDDSVDRWKKFEEYLLPLMGLDSATVQP